jgi:hypothetical protein
VGGRTGSGATSAVARSLPVLRQADIRGLDELPAVTRSLRVLDAAGGGTGIDGLRGLRPADLRYLVDLVRTFQRTAAAVPGAGAEAPPGVRGEWSGMRTPAVSALLARECAVPGARRVLVMGGGPRRAWPSRSC